MKTVPCPTCKKPVPLGAEFFPFCSDRCRLIDLGRWADEQYRIPAASGQGQLPDEEPDEE
ncbi:MAG: DNA gyrase inhibitor YacG [Bryobacteraceae bacterium]|nr:DNA gyrase inhibitor YacG [Bryobacteraceae bacterium]